MSALEEARDRLLSLQEVFAASAAGGPAWLARLRDEGRDRFRERGLPHTKLEEWRYTNLAPLADAALALPGAEEQAVGREELETLAFPVFACSLHVFVDGRYHPGLSALGARSDVHVESLAALREGDAGPLEARLGGLVDTKAHPLAALNTAFLDDGAVLVAPRGSRHEEPLHVVFLSTGSGRLSSPRLLIVAEEGSRVQLIQDFVSLGSAGGFTNAAAEVFVGANASVDLVTLQREGGGSLHTAFTAARLERDARFGSHLATLDGRLVRNDLEVTLAGEGSDATLNGLFVGSGERVVDNHTLVDHAVPHGTSRELYKGILGGASRGVFRGRVVVRPDAQKTSAEQSNPNLLLADSAEIDTKPQLEIYADDVKCSHGSTVGQLEEDALFYLRARGIGESEARDLLTRGFAHEILEAMPVEALREGLDEALETSLSAATGSTLS